MSSSPSNSPQQYGGAAPHQNGGPGSAEPPLDPATAAAGAPPAGEDSLDTSFFPAPAHYYKRYTETNLAVPRDSTDPLHSEDPKDPPFLAKELDPPNVDWIVEGGSYSVFGETWPVEEVLPTLEEMGVKELFVRGADRSSSLLTLLRSLLLTYTQLVSSLLSPPPALSSLPPPGPNGEEPPTDPERLVEHIRLITSNMHHLVNELRPVQARETLKTLMRSQIEQRRSKTIAIQQKCEELSTTLARLQGDLSTIAATSTTSTIPSAASDESGLTKDVKTKQALARERLRAAADELDA